MLVVANPHRTALHNDNLPDGPLTERQRAIADAIRGCSALADTCSAPARQTTAIAVCEVTLGTSPDVARWQIEAGLARAEAELIRLRALYACYGPEPFMPRVEPDQAVRAGATRHETLVAIMRAQSAAGRVMVRAGGRRVERDASGSYVLAETEAA